MILGKFWEKTGMTNSEKSQPKFEKSPGIVTWIFLNFQVMIPGNQEFPVSLPATRTLCYATSGLQHPEV